MANDTHANDPAFSKSAFYHPDGGFDRPENGLTKREYFAAMALQGILSGPSDLSYYAAVNAVSYADELIKALNNQ